MIWSPFCTFRQFFHDFSENVVPAWPQKTSQICVLLLQVASLGDFKCVSGMILITSWCFQHHVGAILMYPTLFWLHFSLSGNLFSWIFWNCAPRLCRKHNSEYSHKAFLIKHLPFWISKRPELTPCWWWCSALSLCCSLLSPFIPSMPPKLNLKKRNKYVYHCYRWPPSATLMIYPT